jgi:GT2 family glycosyltransferase
MDAMSAAAENLEFNESPASPCCSVVVLTRNRGHFLPQTLAAILAQAGPTREVLVFDNGSTDHTPLVAARFGVRYFATPELGLAAMRQKGLEQARGEFVIMCDDDCVPQPGWLAGLVGRFGENPGLALLGGRIVNIGFPGNVEKGLGRFGRNGQIILGVPPEEASYFGGANLGLRRRAALVAGGFDPFLVSGYEEGDLATALLEHGYQVGYEPRATVEHHNVAATQRTRWRWRHSGMMRVYFFLKHFRPRGLAWGRFLAWELYLQLRTLVKERAVPFPRRLLAVTATLVSLPWLVVQSGQARKRLVALAA